MVAPGRLPTESSRCARHLQSSEPVTTIRFCATGLVVVMVAAAPTAHQESAPTLPPLPVVALDAFPSDARTAMARALADATRRPRDGAAAGELGITLQAWEQWEAAHAAYRRAHVLAPAAAEWQYLDGMVLQRL